MAPHLGNHGGGNTAWIDEFEGTPILFAQREGSSLALASSAGWLKRSAGYVGSSDGWQDLKAHKKMTSEYTRAKNGNVALTGEIDLSASQGNFTLSLGFGNDPANAARNAIATLHEGFEQAKHDYMAGWQQSIKQHSSQHNNGRSPNDLSHTSLAVLRTHESKTAPGAFIASLSIPWGSSKGDADLGGYHLVWPRDMVETAGGLLAAGAHDDARRVLFFLQKTQESDGHWAQNMWVDGKPYWDGIQMDETAMPILLADLAHREKALDDAGVARFWPMVRKAAGYLVRNGPVSPQDRWEEDPGYSPFTVAAEIAALLAAADLADLNHEAAMAHYLREIADVWHDSIDRWMYASGTNWCRQFGVAGYYVRIAPTATGEAGSSLQEDVDVKNVRAAEDSRRASHLVSPDALALVRFGLIAAGNPRIRDTAKVIDALLKVETPSGSTWHRYNDDGYGEHKDGSPFDGTGIGRGWPLLTGERAHHELAAGCIENAQSLLAAMASFANQGGLISEQVWDAPDIPDKELHVGRPSGSATPLVWAHAEHLKLRRSLHDGRVFDMPPQTVKRYLTDKTVYPRMVWRFNHKIRSIPAGKILRIETLAPAVIHWSGDDWKTIHDVTAREAVLGMHIADLETKTLAEGRYVKFTLYWPDAEHWQGEDFTVRVGSPPQNAPSTAGKSQ